MTLAIQANAGRCRSSGIAEDLSKRWVENPINFLILLFYRKTIDFFVRIKVYSSRVLRENRCKLSNSNKPKMCGLWTITLIISNLMA